MLEVVEPRDQAVGLPVAGAPKSEMIAIHFVVRTPPSVAESRLLGYAAGGVTFVSLRGGRWTHCGLAPGKMGKLFSDRTRTTGCGFGRSIADGGR